MKSHFNERIRIFIQLEQLFRQFKDKIETITNLDKVAAINFLLDIISMLKTYNLKLHCFGWFFSN